LIGRRIDRNAQTNRWRQLPAAEKAVFAIGLMIASLASKGWLVQGMIIVTMVSLLVRGARVPFRDVLATATIPVGFIAASTLAQCVTLRFDHGTPLLGLSWAALEPAAYVGFRSFACVLALLGLALTTPLTDILRLLRRMGVAPEVSDIALMMFRFIWLTLDCAERGAQSQANRLGYSTYRRTLHSLGLLLASLLPRVLGRAQRLEAGLSSRGYTGELRFAELQQPTSRVHFAAILGLVLSVAFIGRVLP
jgi:cobalt/nickel transport system permease protein